MPRPQLEETMLIRLNRQVHHFRKLELLPHWPQDATPELAGWADLQSLPVLQRQDLQELFPLLQQRWGKSTLAVLGRSGGSTGEPTRFFQRRGYNASGVAFNNVMLLALGWKPGLPRLCLWGSDRETGSTPAHEASHRHLGGLTIYGGFSPDEAEYHKFYEAVRDSGGCAVYGFTTLLEQCARLMIERGWRLPTGCVKAAWTGAEMQFPRQRQLIGEAFGLPPRNSYGGRECGWMAAECSQGTLHISPRYIIEALDPQTMVQQADGQVGLLAVTDLFQEFTPFIRYVIGDLGAVGWQECACGRRGFCLRDLSGRISDMIQLPSGVQISGLFLNHLIKEFPAIRQAQVVRVAPSKYELQYLGEQMPEEESSHLQVLFAREFSGVDTAVRSVDRLELTSAGKLLQFRDISQQQV